MRGLTARSSATDKTVTQQKRKMKKGSKPERTGVAGREREEEEGCSAGGEKYVHCALLGDGMVGKTCLTLSYTQHVFTDRYTATVFDNYPVPVTVGGEQFTLSLFDTAGQRDYESLRAYTYQSSEVLVLCFSVCERESFYSVVNCWLPEIQRHIKGKRPLLLVGTQIDLRTSPSSSSPSSPSTDLRTSSSSDFRTPSCTSSDPRKTSTSSSNLGTPSCFSYADFGASEFRSSSPTSSSTPSSPAFSSSPRDSLSSISSSFSDLRSFSSSFSSSGQDEVSTEEGSQLAKMIGADCYIECSARSEEGVRQVFEHVVCSALKYRKKKSKILGRLFFKEKPLSDKALQRAASTLNIPVSKLEDPR